MSCPPYNPQTCTQEHFPPQPGFYVSYPASTELRSLCDLCERKKWSGGEAELATQMKPPHLALARFSPTTVSGQWVPRLVKPEVSKMFAVCAVVSRWQ